MVRGVERILNLLNANTYGGGRERNRTEEIKSNTQEKWGNNSTEVLVEARRYSITKMKRIHFNKWC